MSCNSRTIECIINEEKPEFVYAVAVFPQWASWHPTSLPRPIADWILAHCPDVDIEPVAGLEGRIVEFPEGHELAIDRLTLPGPIFRIGFNAEQADQFYRYWHDATQGAWNDFLFLSIGPEVDESQVPTIEDIQECIDDFLVQWAQAENDAPSTGLASMVTNTSDNTAV